MIAFICVILTVVIAVLIFNLKSPGKRIEHEIEPKGSLDSDEVMRSIGLLLGPPLASGNRVTPLHNGAEIFPAMLKAIASAQISITFETFIYWSGTIGLEFAEALSERARAGIPVNVLLDWAGSRNFDENVLQKMRDAGVCLERYRPLRWYNVSRLNNRTHRKILVIDGKLGFTGGVGIADEWQGHAQDKDHWRDSHFKVEGPVVGQLQSAFLDNWNATHADVPHGNEYFPVLEEKGDLVAQVFKSSPEEGSGSVRLMYLYAIAHAKKSIRIANSYFVPDSHVRKCLVEAVRRGVRIEVIVPGKHIDTKITRRASRAIWGEMLQAGIRIYEYEPTMFHCKYMIVDQIWVSVGSTNMDNRSFRLNDESNLNIIGSSFAEQMLTVFERDRACAKEMTFETWQKRPVIEKIVERLSWLLRSQV